MEKLWQNKTTKQQKTNSKQVKELRFFFVSFILFSLVFSVSILFSVCLLDLVFFFRSSRNISSFSFFGVVFHIIIIISYHIQWWWWWWNKQAKWIWYRICWINSYTHTPIRSRTKLTYTNIFCVFCIYSVYIEQIKLLDKWKNPVISS